jgi:hypothetical protein
MEFYSAIKRNETMSFAGRWMELELILLNDISQSHKDKYCVFSLICRLWEGDGWGGHESKRETIRGMEEDKGGESKKE